jgi:hypothetical protein
VSVREHAVEPNSKMTYAQLLGGHGGYNPDHEFFGYRQSI